MSQTFLCKCVTKVGKRAKKRNEGEGGGEEKDTLDHKQYF